MIHHTTRVEFLSCMLCGEMGLGPVGAPASICMDCLAGSSHCFDCASEVTVTVYTDETVTLDVKHDAGCPLAA